jgi:hypothetical protein
MTLSELSAMAFFLLTFVSIIIGFIAFVGSIYTFRKKDKQKSLSYQEINFKTLLTTPDRFKIFAKNQIVPAYSSIAILKIFSSGRTPIEIQDYNEDLAIGFGKQANLLLVDIISNIPNNLNIILKNTSHENEVQIEPIFLNYQDSFTVRIVYTGHIAGFISSRIDGIDKISNSDNSRFNETTKTIGYTLSTLFIIDVTTYIVASLTSFKYLTELLYLVTYISCPCTIILSILWLYLLNRKRRKEILFVV